MGTLDDSADGGIWNLRRLYRHLQVRRKLVSAAVLLPGDSDLCVAGYVSLNKGDDFYTFPRLHPSNYQNG